MSKKTKWILLAVGIVLVLLTAAAAVWVVFAYIPYRDAQSAMPGGADLTLEAREGGRLLLTWPESPEADFYRVELYRPVDLETAPEGNAETEPPVPVYSRDVRGACTAILPAELTGQELTLVITSVVEYEAFGQPKERLGDSPIMLTVGLDLPAITALRWSADPETGVVHIAFDKKEGDLCRVYLRRDDGSLELLRTLTEDSLELTFGAEGEFPIPDYDSCCSFVFDACRSSDALDFYGMPEQAECTVVREDLLGRDLDLTITDAGHNVCVLTWNETKGHHYVVQALGEDGTTWETLCEIPRDGVRSYTSDHLPTFSKFTFRVIAEGGQVITGSNYAALSQPAAFETGASPIYCTIWPVQELEGYSGPDKTEVVATVPAMEALCVLDESYGMLGVEVGGVLCYIDSSYCMINLPEYLGELCSYDITNSYESLYMVHEFAIPEVTGEVVEGYAHVRLSGGGYLVPLLYPTAQKLTTAALSANAQGYRLKIYDSFRPNRATRAIYDLTNEILDEPLPEEPYFSNVDIEDLNLPDPTTPAPTDPEAPTEPTDPSAPTEEPELVLTYREVMVGDSWDLSSFLAAGRSMHNLGIALDLTLESLDGGWELEMQTRMHDLSCYSVLSRNNANANLLADIMKDAGFGTLVSEWWHFQDNEARDSLGLPTVWGGVSPECWMKDDEGWRYRRSSGAFLTSCTETIDGVEYTFDENGYVVGEQVDP